MAGVGHLDFRPGTRPTAIDFYRNLPGIDMHTLRTEVLPDGLLPHEAAYMQRAKDPDDFRLTGNNYVADRLLRQLRSGVVTDESLEKWLTEHGIDHERVDLVQELGGRISKAHLLAVTAYTGPDHKLINHATRTHLWANPISQRAVRMAFDQKIQSMVQEYLQGEVDGRNSDLPLPLMPLIWNDGGERPGARERWVESAKAMKRIKDDIARYKFAGAKTKELEAELRQVRREQRLAGREMKQRTSDYASRLFDELRWHADMVHDLLLQLPAVGSRDEPVLAYRGDGSTPVHSPIYGSKLYPFGTAREFLSASRELQMAVSYMIGKTDSSRKVLVVYRLTGGYGRDISAFSTLPGEAEVLFPPLSHTRQVNDPALVQQVRDELAPFTALKDVDYDIIVMEED
jgi:hypothetical protein